MTDVITGLQGIIGHRFVDEQSVRQAAWTLVHESGIEDGELYHSLQRGGLRHSAILARARVSGRLRGRGLSQTSRARQLRFWHNVPDTRCQNCFGGAAAKRRTGMSGGMRCLESAGHFVTNVGVEMCGFGIILGERRAVWIRSGIWV